MNTQKKVMDVNPGTAHIVVIRHEKDKYNPFHVYLVISVTGSPVRRRMLTKYGDFMSCIHFLRYFFTNGLDAMCYTDMLAWIRSRSA